MDISVTRKELYTIVFLSLLIFGLTGYMFFSYKAMEASDRNCYYRNVNQCNACQMKNMTYSVCGQKCMPYRGEESACYVVFWQNCSENVPWWCEP